MPGDVDGMPRACSPAEILHNAPECESELERVPKAMQRSRWSGEKARRGKEKEKRKEVGYVFPRGKRSGARLLRLLLPAACEPELIRRGRQTR